MLSHLDIKNYALIDDLNVNFSSGLTIITGETGAGKSIILGGLSLILGKRADLSQVKDKSKKCVVEATFDITKYDLKSLFKSEDLDYEPFTIIRREILPSGKSRAFINDTPVKLGSLQLLGQHLLDIHSQHETLQLTQDDFQFQVIDALSDNLKIIASYSQKLDDFKSLKYELSVLKEKKNTSIKELDYNRFLLKELEEAKLTSDVLEDLETEYETLNNVEEIKEQLAFVMSSLTQEESGLLSVLGTAKQAFSKIANYGSDYNQIFERIQSAQIELDDISQEIYGLQEDLEANPERLEYVSSKLSVINSLLQKHSVASTEELITIQEKLGNKVFETETIDQSIIEIQEKIEMAASELKSICNGIHENRLKIIPNLTMQLEKILKDLGMPNARFQIIVEATEQFLANGSDRIQFLFSANKGGQFLELKKSASGGELSRIMLAIKFILSKYINLPTIIFDEIDTGVSGEISNKMASIMQDMSKLMQVYTVTHLPQIAAKGDVHFKVFKEDFNDKTRTQLKQLNDEERIVEIAQMLGGSDLSTSAIAHAKELLN